MESIVIPAIQPVAAAQEIPQRFSEAAVPYRQLMCVNWEKDYSYHPRVLLGLAHCGEALLVHYRVREEYIRALAEADGGPVWEDSCCEIFVALPGEGPQPYYNIECNCAGTLLLCYGIDRHSREPAPAEVLRGIDRWASLGRQLRPMTHFANSDWELALRIPVSSLFHSQLSTFADAHLRFNVYKCGDKLEYPHFVSLFPIDTPNPDFHRPEFFGEANFAK